MENNVFKVDGFNYEFRISKMNAIELLAFQTQFNFTDLASSEASIKNSLEKIEVNAGGKWIPVKIKDRDVYTPDEINTNVVLLVSVLNKFSELLKEVFPKSEE